MAGSKSKDGETKAREQRADEGETSAHREALDLYVKSLLMKLGAEGDLGALTETRHEHTDLVLDGAGHAMLIKVTVAFGKLVDQSEIKDLIEAAQRSPGDVPTA